MSIKYSVKQHGNTPYFQLKYPVISLNNFYSLLILEIPVLNIKRGVNNIKIINTRRRILTRLTGATAHWTDLRNWSGPHQSPDLSPLDYSINHVLKEKVRSLLPGMSRPEHVRVAIKKAWKSMDRSYIEKCIDHFPKRLAEVIKADGAHIEHLMQSPL